MNAQRNVAHVGSARHAEEKAADQQTEKMAREAIEEARMVLPGIQALFGFQLMAVFNQRLNELGEAEKLTHFVSALLIALSIGPIMTPAAYHRHVEPGSV
jgi:Family of unknown function (DUF6328)